MNFKYVFQLLTVIKCRDLQKKIMVSKGYLEFEFWDFLIANPKTMDFHHYHYFVVILTKYATLKAFSVMNENSFSLISR